MGPTGHSALEDSISYPHRNCIQPCAVPQMVHMEHADYTFPGDFQKHLREGTCGVLRSHPAGGALRCGFCIFLLMTLIGCSPLDGPWLSVVNLCHLDLLIALYSNLRHPVAVEPS